MVGQAELDRKWAADKPSKVTLILARWTRPSDRPVKLQPTAFPARPGSPMLPASLDSARENVSGNKKARSCGLVLLVRVHRFDRDPS